MRAASRSSVSWNSVKSRESAVMEEAPSVAETLQVPDEMVGIPVEALVLIPVPPYWAPIAVPFQVALVNVWAPSRSATVPEAFGNV